MLCLPDSGFGWYIFYTFLYSRYTYTTYNSAKLKLKPSTVCVCVCLCTYNILFHSKQFEIHFVWCVRLAIETIVVINIAVLTQNYHQHHQQYPTTLTKKNIIIHHQYRHRCHSNNRNFCIVSLHSQWWISIYPPPPIST